MQLFQKGSGTFVPLTDDKLGSLTEPQHAAYTEVSDAVRALADAEAELATATAQVEANLSVLADAQKNAPRFDPDAARVALVKEMIASQAME